MTYNELLAILYQKTKHKNEIPPPADLPYPCIHIAGSNGKGTVAWKIAESLKFEGFKVGLYTSPHISSFRERIRINGGLIPEKDIVKRLKGKIHQNSGFFNITTEIAFSYFADHNVDIAVFETGLGGIFDATNAISNPLLTIITSLSLEHTDLLGNTLQDIAKAKAGILKKSVPVILGSEVPKELIAPYAKKLKCPLFQSLFGGNTSTAKLALSHLPFSFKKDNTGLLSLPPCRMERIDHPTRTIILDVAHNPAGFHFLFRQIQKKYENRPIKCLLALSNKKPIADCLKITARFTRKTVLFEHAHERLYPAHILKTEAQKLGLNLEICHDLFHFIEESSPEDILLILGSFFMMSQIRGDLGINETRDSLI